MKRLLALCLMLMWITLSAQAASERVVSLYGSFAGAWLLAGGTLAGVTEDAVSERELPLDESVQIIGTTKLPNMELILSQEPDLILYSTEIAGQEEAAALLGQMGIDCMGFDVNTYEDYLAMMEELCALTGRDDLYQAQVDAVRAPIEALRAQAEADERFGQRTALLLRAYSTNVRAKGSDNLAGAMLQDMGLVNIADDAASSLENLTLEVILEADPDYIFVVVMGSDGESAMQALSASMTGNPAWQGLTAVREGRFIVLDRALFHQKPNARWAQSYQYLWNLLYEADEPEQ